MVHGAGNTLREWLRSPDRTLVMGILNLTPDSFSDGGRYASVEAGVARAHEMVAEGADIIDIGGESTRPGHVPVDEAEELHRVMPLLEQLLPTIGVPVSIDTTKSAVAERAIDLGAAIINDQWGLQGDPRMAAVAARFNVPVIAMHNKKGDSDYADLIKEVIEFLRRSLAIADAAGLDANLMIVDPGIGFAKTAAQNIEVLRRLAELRVLGRPILLGTSRKSTIGRLLGDAPPDERVEGTAATVALGIAAGADIVRVHDVKAMTRVVRVADALTRPRAAAISAMASA